MMRSLLLLTSAFALTAAVASAQRPQAAPPQAVNGRVTDDTGRPISHARVRIDGAAVTTRADVEGTFTIAAPAGSTLIVTKAGFTAATAPVGARATETSVALQRAAAITGRITDSTGEPVVAVTVTATRVDDRRVPRWPLTVVTDDRGEYRIGSLASGRYVVSVQTTGNEPAPLTALAAANAAGISQAIAASGIRPTVTTSYYPGTDNGSAAAALAVAAGEERRGIDIAIPVERAWQDPYLVFPVGLIAVTGTGDATVQGIVADTDGHPLARARVTIDGTVVQPRAGGAPALGRVLRTAITDAEGRYAFTGLLPAAYDVRAAKAGYSVPAATLTSFQPPRPVRAGETLSINLTLAAPSIVSGRVRDEFGDAVEHARVLLLQTHYERGRRRLVPVVSGERLTDDRGEFRLSTRFTGEFIVAVTVDDSRDGDVFGYARTFYPGTLAAEESRPVTLNGGEVAGIDLALVGAPTTRVAGTVVDSTGMPAAKAKVSLISRGSMAMQSDARLAGDGTFEFANVAPGQYILQADYGRTTMFTEGEFVALPLAVSSGDLLALQVQMQPGSFITGRFVYDRFNRATDPPPTAATIAAIPADFDLAPAGTASSQANAVGVFQLRNVTGARRLVVTRVPPRYMVKAILVGGRDVIDEPLTFGAREQSLDDVEVVLTDRISELSGTVSDLNSRPVPGVKVLLFPTDRQKWHPGSRYLRTMDTTAAGAFG